MADSSILFGKKVSGVQFAVSILYYLGQTIHALLTEGESELLANYLLLLGGSVGTSARLPAFDE